MHVLFFLHFIVFVHRNITMFPILSKAIMLPNSSTFYNASISIHRNTIYIFFDNSDTNSECNYALSKDILMTTQLGVSSRSNLCSLCNASNTHPFSHSQTPSCKSIAIKKTKSIYSLLQQRVGLHS